MEERNPFADKNGQCRDNWQEKIDNDQIDAVHPDVRIHGTLQVSRLTRDNQDIDLQNENCASRQQSNQTILEEMVQNLDILRGKPRQQARHRASEALSMDEAFDDENDLDQPGQRNYPYHRRRN